jgi:hypothetical protein
VPIKNYTTKIPVIKTLGEIQGILISHGARKIMSEYGENGHVLSLAFSVDTPTGEQAIRLPANSGNVLAVLKKQHIKADIAQAERVAWRTVKDWVDAQMAILESEMVTMGQIFLPYMLDGQNNTVYELFEKRQLLSLPEVDA